MPDLSSLARERLPLVFIRNQAADEPEIKQQNISSEYKHLRQSGPQL